MRLIAVLALWLGLQTAPAPALQQMVEAERAFAARAAVVGWKQAFLEYFADSAVGFDGNKAEPAKNQIRAIPDPAKGVQLLWEPRYGDIAASGELGWLTGPSTSINPARDKGAPRHGNYASVWKRQPDGTFKVVMDVGVNLPMPAEFASGFRRVPDTNRYTGNGADAQATLAEADRALAAAARKNQADAYRGRLSVSARAHRSGFMPLVGAQSILGWLASQPAVTMEHRFAEAARSGDLGYTWGTHGTGAYVRVWSRDASGTWRVVLDVVQ
jgi:hypothetical protein